MHVIDESQGDISVTAMGKETYYTCEKRVTQDYLLKCCVLVPSVFEK